MKISWYLDFEKSWRKFSFSCPDLRSFYCYILNSWSMSFIEFCSKLHYRYMKMSNLSKSPSLAVFFHLENVLVSFKGCVHYIFATLFCKSKGEHLWNKEKYVLLYFESSFRFWDNQILTFQIFKSHDVIKCPCLKHETNFTE